MSLGSFLRKLFWTNYCDETTVDRPPGERGLAPRVYHVDYDNVFTGLINAWNDLGWHLVRASRDQGQLFLQRPWGLTTWGDAISVSLRTFDHQAVRVDVSSFGFGELFDWGRHSRNVRRYLSDLDTRVKAA